MKKKISYLAFALASFATFCVPAFGSSEKMLPVENPVPDVKIHARALSPLVVEGTNPAQGVAGAFIRDNGQGKIAVAGGALFPEKGPADGGKKKFYDVIWELDLAKNAWRVCEEKLPVPAAYGISLDSAWLGGENADGKLNVAWDAPDARTGIFSVLPTTLDNAAGAGRWIGGGNVGGVPANKAFEIQINSFPGKQHEWKPLPDFPGTPRVQPVAGVLKTPRGDAFALVGGFYFDKEKNAATLDRAGVIYYPAERKWEPLPPLPESLSEAGLVGAVAVSDGVGGMLIFGGVNAEIFKDALENPAPDYLRHDPAWYKFNADVLRLSVGADGNAKWEKLATVPATARAGAAAIVVSDASAEPRELRVLYVCGELKPGFRSPDCALIKIEKK